jgi:NAD(P)-dependent dehydrogenase (short-subunit alcohol dehydrogenase family)
MTKRALVTGASAGIGRDTALRLVAEGFEVFAAARRVERLESLRDEAGPALHPITLDVNDASSIDAATDAIFEATGGYGVDAVVNNAGIAIAGALADVSDEELRLQFETNVFGLMSVTRAFLPKMIERRAGRIVNVSSSGGQISLPLVGVYHATKFAVEALSDALRWELAPFGVRVSVIAPGPIRTEFGDKLMASAKSAPSASMYGPALERADRIQAFAEKRMQEPRVVTRDIVHALTARRPRPRYVEPRLLGLVVKLYQLSPTWLSDFVITRLMGLTPRVLLGGGASPQPVAGA